MNLVLEIVAGTATHTGIAVGNHWGMGTGSTLETPSKPVSWLGYMGHLTGSDGPPPALPPLPKGVFDLLQ